MKLLTVAALGLAMLLGTGTAGAMPESKIQTVKPSFTNFDIDRNGFISTHEAVKDDYLQRVFKEMDSNGDQQLSQEEFEEHQEADEKKSG